MTTSMHEATRLPRIIASRAVKIVRPRDAADVYVNPAGEFRRLADAGALARVAHGYYAVVPQEVREPKNWRPSVEAIALGIGVVDYGRDEVALSGVSAARALNALPRAVSTAVVSVPVRRSPVQTSSGTVFFWHRQSESVETQKTRTELAVGWMTTASQTLLDLADRPRLGNLGPSTISETLWHLAPMVDWQRVYELSEELRRRSAYVRAYWVCAGLAPSTAPPPPPGRPVTSQGLRSWSGGVPALLGVVD